MLFPRRGFPCSSELWEETITTYSIQLAWELPWKGFVESPQKFLAANQCTQQAGTGLQCVLLR